MYKTIRHGENSLQYTILPQNDDFRIENKLSSGSGRPKGKRARRRSIFAYCGLIFVFTVIIGAIAVPFLVSSECLPLASQWLARTKATWSASGNQTATPAANTAQYVSSSSSQPTVTLPSSSISSSSQEAIAITESFSTASPAQSVEVDETTAGLNAPTTSGAPPVTTSTTTTTTTPATTTTAASSTTTTTAKAVAGLPPLFKTRSKKPIILPVLAKTNSIVRENGVSVERPVKEPSQNWINAHWPYVDPSPYFQWTGYKSKDAVLLPAILGIALVGALIIIALCLILRNKRIIVSSLRKKNRNDIEETSEDNATLLTTSNISDDE